MNRLLILNLKEIMQKEGEDADGRRGCGRKERMKMEGEDAEGHTGPVCQGDSGRNIVRSGQFLNHQKATEFSQNVFK